MKYKEWDYINWVPKVGDLKKRAINKENLRSSKRYCNRNKFRLKCKQRSQEQRKSSYEKFARLESSHFCIPNSKGRLKKAWTTGLVDISLNWISHVAKSRLRMLSSGPRLFFPDGIKVATVKLIEKEIFWKKTLSEEISVSWKANKQKHYICLMEEHEPGQNKNNFSLIKPSNNFGVLQMSALEKS